ncbi:MAG: pyrroline-5-carboxylate reductase [Pseudomonadota bacterium]
MSEQTITFIGGGNMAASLIGGLINNGYAAARVRASEPLPARRDELASRFGIATFSDNAEAAAGANVVVLAVKPQVMPEAAKALGPSLADASPLVLSIAAGIRATDILRWLAFEAAIVRTMPNTPALVGSGVTGMYANARVDSDQREAANQIMQAVGSTVWVDEEDQIDAVTAVSGSGPAYFFLLMELLERTGTDLGLDAEAARQLALQTALGAARIAIEGDDPPGVLREKVTSPAGTTERALNIMADGGMHALVAAAVTGARDRARELADELGQG